MRKISAPQLYLVIIFGQAVFAATPLFIKIALADFDHLSFGVWRFLISIAILNMVLFLRSQRLLPDRQDFWQIVFLGFLAIPINQGLLFYGLQFTTPGHSALLYALTPIMIYIFAIFLAQEKFQLRRMRGILLAFTGVALILIDKKITIEPDFVKGDLLIIVGMLAWALYTVLGKNLVQKIGSLRAITNTMTFGTLLYLPIGIPYALKFEYTQAGQKAWSALLFTAILSSAIAYPIWYWALKYLEPSRLSVFIYMQPIIATLLSCIFLSEQLTANFLIGGLIVLAGVYITEKSRTNSA